MVAVAVALRPAEFDAMEDADGRAVGGGGWQIGDTVYEFNPARNLTAEVWADFHLWRRSRSDMGGTAHLPEAGGLLEQAVVNLEVFDTCERAHALLKERDREARGKTS